MLVVLLSGVRNDRNSHLAQEIYERMKKHFSQSHDVLISVAILLANVYGSIGDIDKTSEIRIQLAKSGVKKKNWTFMDCSQ